MKIINICRIIIQIGYSDIVDFLNIGFKERLDESVMFYCVLV